MPASSGSSIRRPKHSSKGDSLCRRPSRAPRGSTRIVCWSRRRSGRGMRRAWDMRCIRRWQEFPGGTDGLCDPRSAYVRLRLGRPDPFASTRDLRRSGEFLRERCTYRGCRRPAPPYPDPERLLVASARRRHRRETAHGLDRRGAQPCRGQGLGRTLRRSARGVFDPAFCSSLRSGERSKGCSGPATSYSCRCSAISGLISKRTGRCRTAGGERTPPRCRGTVSPMPGVSICGRRKRMVTCSSPSKTR